MMIELPPDVMEILRDFHRLISIQEALVREQYSLVQIQLRKERAGDDEPRLEAASADHGLPKEKQ